MPLLSQESLQQIASLMNRVGVLEALRILAQEGLPPKTGALRCGQDFWVVPYTEHLHRKHAAVGPPPTDATGLPTIMIPELVLLDILPDFFRTYCQPYRFAEQLHRMRTSELSSTRFSQRESKAEQIARDYFGRFVNDFLNAHLYQTGAKGWAEISRWFAPRSRHLVAEHPLFRQIQPLLEEKATGETPLPEAAWKVAMAVPLLSMRGMDRGRWQWGLDALLRAIWPHEPFSLRFPGMAPAWGRLHPSSQTRLGLQCGHLGQDFYVGSEIQQQSTVLLVELHTSSTRLIHLLQPGPLVDRITQIANHWLASRQLTLDFRIHYAGALAKLPWYLGDSSSVPTTLDNNGVKSVGRLGSTTYLTSE